MRPAHSRAKEYTLQMGSSLTRAILAPPPSFACPSSLFSIIPYLQEFRGYARLETLGEIHFRDLILDSTWITKLIPSFWEAEGSIIPTVVEGCNLLRRFHRRRACFSNRYYRAFESTPKSVNYRVRLERIQHRLLRRYGGFSQPLNNWCNR